MAKAIEVQNTGTTKTATLNFSRRGKHFTVEVESNMQSISTNVPRVSTRVISWTTAGRLSGVILDDPSGFEKEIEKCVAMSTMTTQEIKEACTIRNRIIASFAQTML